MVRSPSSGVNDGDKATIIYLWLVVQVHRVIDNYERHLFDKHPYFSSILTRHQSQSNSEGDLDVTLKKLGKLEDSVSGLKSWADTHQGYINTLLTRK